MEPTVELLGEHPALDAFELVLSLEKLVTLKLQDLANAAESSGDRQLSGFVDTMLSHQAEDINEVRGGSRVLEFSVGLSLTGGQVPAVVFVSPSWLPFP